MSKSLLKKLIKRFSNQKDKYQATDYNEAQTRADFIMPFFNALGWDVNNEKGVAEPYRPVVHEDILKIKKAPYKRPDYSFRVGGVRKFFVEAKKPSINLKTDPEPAYQVRRYGWNAKLSLSIVTNFAELAVYDCRRKPEPNDDPSIGRVWYLTYTDYVEHWDELVERLSFDAVWQGQFDQYASQVATTKGAIEIDTAFLDEISRWRETLAVHLIDNNPTLTERQLNSVIQQTIDRIIFLRIAEDRGIEDYGRLLSLTTAADIYPRLFELFVEADERYNSGLFHFKTEKGRQPPDTLTPNLKITDAVLQPIINKLYYPNSPYEFSVLPADILGQIYERFLGKVIRLTSEHEAIVEEKPDIKKAGGVYYTPSYIVHYLVQQTIGNLLEKVQANNSLTKLLGNGKHAVSRLKILDPACGSGSFLLGAYQFLLDWYLQQYLTEPNKWMSGRKPRLYQASGGTWKLTISERQRILLNHIYGVDIDPQAVEVTKLSLLLKVLEDEQSVISQLSLFKERALPDINNIKCGNSLIGQDFYNGQPLGLIDEETQYQINAFDWETEFAQVMQTGGFDVVIGNPPYVRQELLGESKPYLKKNYHVYHGVADLYVYFIEKGLSLLRQNGLFGIIVANKWMRANYGLPLRQWLKQRGLIEIIDFGDLPVFEQATAYPSILRLEKTAPKTTFWVTIVKTLDFSELTHYVTDNRYLVQHAALTDKSWSLVEKETQALLDKLHQQGIPLHDYVENPIYRGILTGLNQAFVIDAETRQQLIADDPNSTDLIKPFLIGRDIKRYQPPKSERYLIFTRRGVDIKKYPAIKHYLLQYQKRLMPKPPDWSGEWVGRKPGSYEWYEIQDTIAYYQEFEKPKIIYPNICRKPELTFDETGYYTNQKCFIIPTTDKYLLGILNSSVTFFLFRVILPKLRGNFYEPSYVHFKDFPIRQMNFDDPTDKANHQKMVQLVEQMFALNQQRAANHDDHTQTLIERRIKATDKQIDQLVYTLYKLTAKDIQRVESNF